MTGELSAISTRMLEKSAGGLRGSVDSSALVSPSDSSSPALGRAGVLESVRFGSSMACGR
eukprot:scaffold187609_cov24-Tisochrysis_lutea.AAC.2